MLGLLAASCLIGVIGVGTAAAAAPTNIKSPFLNTTNPHLGTELTVSPGEWTGNPTLTYQWYRGGTYVFGATEPTYTVSAADFGYELSVWVTGTNGEGSAAVKVKSKVVKAQLAECRATGINAVFKDSMCAQAASGPEGYKWNWTPAGAKVNVSGNGGTAPTSIRWVSSGAEFKTVCSNVEGTAGILDNGTGTSISNLKATLTGCTVAQPAGKECKVIGGKITLNTLEGSTIEQTLEPRFELKPKSEYGGVLGTIGWEGCSLWYLNQSYPMNNASLYGTFSNITHKFVLNEKSLVMQGMAAKLEGASIFTDVGDGAVAALVP